MTDVSLLPDGVSTCTVNFGRAISFKGKGANVTATLSAVFADDLGRLTDAMIVHTATGVALYSGDDQLITGADGDDITFVVPHVDQAGFHDGAGNPVTFWAYVLTAIVKFPSNKKKQIVKTFQPVVGEATIDLDLRPDGAAAAVVSAPTPTIVALSAEVLAAATDATDAAAGAAASELAAAGYSTAAAGSAGTATTKANEAADSADDAALSAGAASGAAATTDTVMGGRVASKTSATATALAGAAADGTHPLGAALHASIATKVALGNALPALELVPFTNYGNSWSLGGVSSTAGAGYWSRVASRNRTKAQVNQGVSGTQSNEILDKITSTWTPNSQGLVGLGDIVLNDLRHWGTDADKATTRECFRSMLARLNAWIVQDSTAASLVYGPGWTAGVSDVTAGRYVDVAWTGPTVNIRVACVTGAGATVTVKDTATGTTVATFTTGGYKEAFEGVIRLSGYSAGTHTVRVSVSAATTISGAIVPMPSPPLIAWLKAGDTVEGGTTQRSRIALYLAECASIVSGYPNVVPIDLNGRGWDKDTMLAPDGLHPSDIGNAFIADRIQTELLAQGFVQGLNSLTGTSAGTYTAPTPSYATGSATAPSAPTGVTGVSGNQVVVSWTRADDGGATLTAQPIQASSDSGTTWTTAATAGPNATTYTIASGLTPATSYIFRVGATNSVGTTYSTPSSAVVIGAAVATYSADTFTRADNAASMGSTETGGFAWTSENSVQGISGNAATIVSSNTTLTGCVFMNDGQADGTFEMTMKTAGTNSTGLLFRASSDALAGYVFWWGSSMWQLASRTAQGTYSQVMTGTTTPVPAVGDKMRVIANGTSIKCYHVTAAGVATLVYTYTSSTNQTNTRHGLWHGNGTFTRIYDDWLHNSLTS